MKLNKIQEKGITLVALIITIIILVIIAGVSIAIAYNSGIVGIAVNGTTNYAEEGGAENRIFNNAMEHISNALEKLKNGSLDDTDNSENTGGELPENTKDTEAGTIVATVEEWITETPVEISTEDGLVVTRSAKVASVYAVATGNGETVPVPNGFYYVGGTIASGVVISDNEADQNKYAGDEDGDIPAGVVYN